MWRWKRLHHEHNRDIEMVSEKSDLLFVYGTLMRGFENAAFLASPERATYLGDGWMTGFLYDVGEFPAFIPADQGSGVVSRVSGEVYRLIEPESVLATLDVIEGVNHQYPERSLFRRECRPGFVQDREQWMWVYVYNQPVDGLPRIVSGDYRGHRRPQATE